jgi:hypothetical protein
VQACKALIAGASGCKQHPLKIIPEITAVIDIRIDGKNCTGLPADATR